MVFPDNGSKHKDVILSPGPKFISQDTLVWGEGSRRIRQLVLTKLVLASSVGGRPPMTDEVLAWAASVECLDDCMNCNPVFVFDILNIPFL